MLTFAPVKNLLKVIMLTFSGLFLGFGHANAMETATHKVDLKPFKAGKEKFLDPKSVKLNSDGTHIKVTVDVGHNATDYVRDNGARSVLKIMLDTDLDPTTGGKDFWRDETGFDFLVASLYACKSFEGGHVCAGNVKDRKVTGYFSKYVPQKWLADKKYFYRIHDPFWKGGKGTLKGSIADVKVAYSDFGLKPGQTIRIMVLPPRSSGSQYKVIKLKLK